MTDAEIESAKNAEQLLCNPRDRAKWLASLGADRAGYVAALRGNAPPWMHPMNVDLYREIGRLLGPKTLAAL